jgi:hypothetical protein
MPLVKSGKKKDIGANIAAEIRAGKPPAQAQAIALNTHRRAGGQGLGAKPRKPKY